MTEVNYILNTMTDHSLIIIDELCRSTSVDEGTALAMAICEDFANSGAYTYVTTHYTLLTKLAYLLLNIKIWQMQTVPSGDVNNPITMKLDFKFALMPGVTTLKGYGIYMARNVWPDGVMKYVNELQELLTEKHNDPEFPELDKQLHLKHDLVCKLEKLKLQKKYTVSNINKYLGEYNTEISKLGVKSQNSQIAIQMPDALMDENTSLDHSIFDAPQNVGHSPPELDSSKIYLDNFQQVLTRVTTSEESLVEIKEKRADKTEEMIFSPVSIHEFFQNSTFSPSKSKKRMQELLTPDSNLDISTSTYHSFGSNQNIEMVIPAVNMSCTASDCSLNFTENALNLEKNGSYEGNDVKDTYSMTQVPGPVLSFCLEANRSMENESPYTNTFAGPLQSDTNRTSTPLISKFQHNARNFGSSSSNIVQSMNNQVESRKPTPKLNFTILNDVRDVDIQSVQEDLESFVEYMQNEDSNSPKAIKQYDTKKRDAFELIPKKSEISLISKNTKGSIKKNIKEYTNKHIFPIVKIIEGPKIPSFEDENSQFDEGIETIVRPVIKNLQPKTQKAFNSLANPKCIPYSPNVPHQSEIEKNEQQLQNNEQNENNKHTICDFENTEDKGKDDQKAINKNKLTNIDENLVDANSQQSCPDDLFNTAKSSSNFGFSPLASPTKSVHENINSTGDTLQENVYQSIDSCENEIQDSLAQGKDKINQTEEAKEMRQDTMQRFNDKSKLCAVNTNNKDITDFKTLNDGDISDKNCFGSLETLNKEHKQSTDVDDKRSTYKILMSERVQIDRMKAEKNNQEENIKSVFDTELRLKNTQKSNLEHSQNSVFKDNSVREKSWQKLINASTESKSTFETDDIIAVANDYAFAKKKFGIEECNEALQKENELIEKIKDMQNKTKQEKKTVEVMQVQHIPHLTAYFSNFSENSEKEKTFIKTSPNQENQDSKKTKKVHSKRLTLGIRPKISKQLGKKNKSSKYGVQETKTGHTQEPNIAKKISLGRNDNGQEINLESLVAKESTNDNKSVILAQQTKTVDEKTLTSVSEASKLRNLDEDLSSSSSGVKRGHLKSYNVEGCECDKQLCDVRQEKTVSTGISEASRKRNLDQLTTSSDDKKSNNEETSNNITFRSVGSDEANKKERNEHKIFRGSWTDTSGSSLKKTVTKEKGGSPDRAKSKFIPPSKLSTKALKEVFFEQDKKFFETSGSSADLAKIWEQRLNRPSLKQLKKSSCVATIRKTQAGVEVIPEKERQKRKYLTSKNKILSSSDGSVNMNIFSDKNAQTFDQFIKSKQTDYKSFNFNFGHEEASTLRADGNMFDFKQVNAVSSEYTQKSFSLTFVRRRSEEFPSSQQSTSNHPFLTPNVDFSLTPDGFYKQNRDDINSIMNKYK